MADFAAAQKRIAARRAASAAANAAATSQQQESRAGQLTRLPPALRVIVQQSLNAWDVVRSPYGTRPSFRVGQVDAELLDEELLDLLKNQAGEGLRLLGAHLKDDYSAEIGLILRSILWKLSIWDHGASYGASLQGLQYIDARHKSSREPPKAWQKIAYALITVGGKYGWQRWEDHLSSIENGYEEPSIWIQRLGRLNTLAGTTHSIAAFASFLVFLYNGKYRTLTDRLLRLRLVPSSSQTSREVSFEYLNRQLVWHAFTEFLLFLLPLVGISRWRRWISRAWKRARASITEMTTGQRAGDDQEEDLQKGELAFLPERTCAICYQDQNPAGGTSEQDITSAGANTGIIGNASTDITNPYESIPCGCIYCYVCLAQRIEAEEGEGWTCLRCGGVTKECRPWDGDVLVERKTADSEAAHSEHTGNGRPSSRKSIAWADELVEDGTEESEMQAVEPRPVEEDEADDHYEQEAQY